MNKYLLKDENIIPINSRLEEHLIIYITPI